MVGSIRAPEARTRSETPPPAAYDRPQDGSAIAMSISTGLGGSTTRSVRVSGQRSNILTV